jgi:hypothetical protein
MICFNFLEVEEENEEAKAKVVKLYEGLEKLWSYINKWLETKGLLDLP